MSDMKATVEPTNKGFSVCGYEKIEYDFEFLDGVFDMASPQLAACYQQWDRCLAVMDLNMFTLYGDQVQRYFDHHGIELRVHKTLIGEKAKSIDTLLKIFDTMNDFGVYRKEPVLVVGGGLVTDVAGFACAAYRCNTNYIRIPTTVIGLIDASVSIKKTLDLLDQHCEALIDTGVGRADDASVELREAADRICRAGICEMLKLETPNLHEIMLDRVIAYGHTWFPLHELVPDPPLRHGHAISIDMAYSATLAHVHGLLSADDHMRLLRLISRAGLSMDHAQLRTAVPVSPMGECVFLNDVTHDMCAALEAHKALMRQFPRSGEGLDAVVDASDTGYTVHGKPLEAEAVDRSQQKGAKVPVSGHNDHINGHANGHASNGVPGGLEDSIDKPGHGAPRFAVAVVDGN
ncbi:3-dehydroquinate synthase domain-containing protein [Hirsutella rhossiliensis]|uniref:3-dehydroquinate synthase domain-containing protein n=1 Tax=Hirsutella rhossiliensis TaxID=111463 RepID=A0A9P8SEF8_9HYPO|nr:3-dehydroquinate synthase domain-containing protein [Hirsutella rhossiliensis]KAH0959626.1 3-dehydroquinate synthase domain-containing protein [Hirsutella rhossiliensis]